MNVVAMSVFSAVLSSERGSDDRCVASDAALQQFALVATVTGDAQPMAIFDRHDVPLAVRVGSYIGSERDVVSGIGSGIVTFASGRVIFATATR